MDPAVTLTNKISSTLQDGREEASPRCQFLARPGRAPRGRRSLRSLPGGSARGERGYKQQAGVVRKIPVWYRGPKVKQLTHSLTHHLACPYMYLTAAFISILRRIWCVVPAYFRVLAVKQRLHMPLLCVCICRYSSNGDTAAAGWM